MSENIIIALIGFVGAILGAILPPIVTYIIGKMRKGKKQKRASNKKFQKTSIFISGVVGLILGLLLGMNHFAINSRDNENNLYSKLQMITIDSSFAISKHEIINKQYDKFWQRKKYHAPALRDQPNFNGDSQPVVYVSWKEAMAYCNWLEENTGKIFRLPTEAEWKKAAGCLDSYIYPWGNHPPDKDLVNFGKKNNKPLEIDRPLVEESKFGIRDMAGNVAEWCYDEDKNLSNRKKVCGASWWDNKIEYLRCDNFRSFPPEEKKEYIGFRIVELSK